MDNGASSYRRFREDGDENGLVEIIKEYRDGLVFYINSFVKNISVAEELAEDTFVLLGTKKPKDKGKGCFKTWLYTIGRNIALNYLRKNSRITEVCDFENQNLDLASETVENLYLQEQRKVILHRAISCLRPEYSQILWLIYFEDFSCGQAARVMKKSVHNIETLVYRARKALKKQLESEGFEYEEL